MSHQKTIVNCSVKWSFEDLLRNVGIALASTIAQTEGDPPPPPSLRQVHPIKSSADQAHPGNHQWPVAWTKDIDRAMNRI